MWSGLKEYDRVRQEIHSDIIFYPEKVYISAVAFLCKCIRVAFHTCVPRKKKGGKKNIHIYFFPPEYLGNRLETLEQPEYFENHLASH